MPSDEVVRSNSRGMSSPDAAGAASASALHPIDIDAARGEGSASARSDEVGSNDGSTGSINDYQFSLVLLQQPRVGAATGLVPQAFNRLPVVPAPIVQVVARDSTGRAVDVDLPYLFCSCSLHQENGLGSDSPLFPVEYIDTPPASVSPPIKPPKNAKLPPPPVLPETGPKQLSALLGTLVCTSHRVTDLEGEPVSLFVFDDLSIRLEGTFSLEFRLGEARPQSPKLTAVMSDPFDVVPSELYPGLAATDVTTPLTRHLHQQQVPIYLPPLAIPRRFMPSLGDDVELAVAPPLLPFATPLYPPTPTYSASP